MITNVFNILHFIFLFTPVLIYFIKIELVQKYIHIIFLLIAITPLHWVFFDGQCISTILNKKMGDFQESETTSQFSENYMGWLYKPIMSIFGWEWNSEGLNKIISLHWIINVILIWNYCFYVQNPYQIKI